MKRPSLVLGAVTMALSVVPVGAPVSAGGAACFAPQKLHSLTVQTRWSKKVYKAGGKAQVTVTITRPGETDPMGYGIPMPSEIPPEPVEDALVTSFIENMFPPVGGYEYTDANGEAVVRFKIPKKLKGYYGVATRGSFYHRSGIPNDCTDVEEEGFRYEPRAFKVE
ncbi:MAG: hypothetical protein ACR2KQ_11415 [Actinomycetota bacterium]